jgi:hypothetical protein
MISTDKKASLLTQMHGSEVRLIANACHAEIGRWTLKEHLHDDN